MKLDKGREIRNKGSKFKHSNFLALSNTIPRNMPKETFAYKHLIQKRCIFFHKMVQHFPQLIR